MAPLTLSRRKRRHDWRIIRPLHLHYSRPRERIACQRTDVEDHPCREFTLEKRKRNSEKRNKARNEEIEI